MSNQLYLAGTVRRWHTTPHVHAQESVAEHSWCVAVLIARYHPSPSAALLKAALYHDCGEYVAGDIPYTAKLGMPTAVREWLEGTEHGAQARVTGAILPLKLTLTPDEQLWLHAADLLSALYYGAKEYQAGNRFMLPMLRRFHPDVYEDLPRLRAQHEELYQHLEGVRP